MKTEREFIDSVYAKYESQKARRIALAKRNKTIYLCASLAACFCVVILGAVRILPSLMGANSAMEADKVYVAANRAETYSVTNGSGVIKYSAELDAKSKEYQYAAEEEITFEECADEAIEAPETTGSETVNGIRDTASENKEIEYSDIEKLILSVVDCSFIEKVDGVTEINRKDETVGFIFPYTSYDDGKTYVFDNPSIIECETNMNCIIVLSADHFTEKELSEIESSVKK